MRIFAFALVLLAFGAAPGQAEPAVKPKVTHGLSLFGDLKYGPDFQHFDYVNPNAPKGGTARLSSNGGFDSLNPFIAKGRPDGRLMLTYDTLMAPSLDEPSAEYGLIAESVEAPEDHAFVIFTLRKEARWHDGTPITPADVVFSFNTLVKKGAPGYRFYYKNVVKAEALDARRVKFTFDKGGNRELPQIMGQLPVIPKAYWEKRKFENTTLDPPLSSGPYKISKVEVNHSISYERVKDYWAADLPLNRGTNNFDRIDVVYFQDEDVELQGLFADVFDYRIENVAKNWATRYNVPQVASRQIVKEEVKLKNPEPFQGFALNLRRQKFSDPRVREAFDAALDFEWMNKNFFFGQYARTESYFQSSELAATGAPGPLELELLEPFRAQLPAQVFGPPYKPLKTDGSGQNRANLLKAKQLLESAGWTVKNGALTNGKTGEVMTVEMLVNSPAFTRIFEAYGRSLEKLGIKTTIRTTDEAQYINRLRNFDFDLITSVIPQSLSPGNEQREFWGTEAAARPESRNYAGIKDAVIDALIDKIVFAPDRAHLVAACRALDRVLTWSHYMVPTWYAPVDRLAYWDRFSHPANPPAYAIGFPDIWWYDAAKAAAVGQKKKP